MQSFKKNGVGQEPDETGFCLHCFTGSGSMICSYSKGRGDVLSIMALLPAVNYTGCRRQPNKEISIQKHIAKIRFNRHQPVKYRMNSHLRRLYVCNSACWSCVKLTGTSVLTPCSAMVMP